MTIQYPPVVSLFGGLYSLYIAWKLRNFKVSAAPPKSRAHLSISERQRKIQIAVWLCIAGGLGLIAGAGLLLWLENSN
jgi:hypothetical protein